MSSKSRKHSPQKGQKPHTPAEILAAGDPQHGLPEASDFDPDELIHVPKESSRWRFILMIGLLIVLLVIFVVPSALMGASGGRGGTGEGFANWKNQAGEDVSMGAYQFTNAKRELDSLFYVHPLMRGRVGVTERSPNDADTARIMILDQLATDSGLSVTDEDLKNELVGSFDFYSQLAQLGGPANEAEYRTRCNRYGGTAKIENTLRKCLRAERVLSIMGSIAAQADPAEIERLWNETHADLTFETVAVTADSLKDAARAELPSDTDLEASLAAKSPIDQRPFMTEEQRALSLVAYQIGSATPQGLLGAYPADAETDAAEQSEAYYNRVFFLRFVRPEPAADAPTTDENGEPIPAPTPYLSQDEVTTECAAEAPIYFALQKWNEELTQKQLAGETVDLQAEAQRLGLSFNTIPPTTRAALTDLENFGGVATAAIGFQTKAGQFFSSVNVLKDALAVTRVDSVQDAALKPFADVREQLANEWTDRRAEELVNERLDSMRSTFEALTLEQKEGAAPVRMGDLREATADAFQAAAQGAGLTVVSTAGFDKGARQLNEWPDSESDLTLFLWRNRDLRAMEVAEVSEVLVDATTSTSYLVRVAQSADRPIAKMSPNDFNQFVVQSERSTRGAILSGMDERYLGQTFGLVFQREESPTEENDV